MQATDTDALKTFLGQHHPFDQLLPDVLEETVRLLESRPIHNGEGLLVPGEVCHHLYILRAGTVDVFDPQGALLARLGEGDFFGQRSLRGTGHSEATVTATADGELLLLPASEFHRLCRNHTQFRYFFAPTGQERLSGAVSAIAEGDHASANLLTTPVEDILRRPVISAAADASVRETAEIMSRAGVSSLLVVDDGRLCGIVTDRDLRNRALARGLDYSTPIQDIMTARPLTIGATDYAYEALIVMARNGFHHLPVVDGEEILGMITSTDLIRRHSTSPLYVVGEVFQQDSVAGLARSSSQIGQLLVSLTGVNASAHSIAHIISSIGEAITGRLLALAEDRLGAPPVPYAWLAAGSLARYEQTAKSDQDNCLLLADEYDAEQHGEYFEQLARFVCDGLDECGYIYCPGDVMAVNSQWRQPLSVWKRYFTRWIDQPEPMALMLSSIFFDLRCLHGRSDLFDELHRHVAEKARKNAIFHAYMAANALNHQPPLGFFRNFVLIKDGEHDDTLDLKLNGIVPIVDIARNYALAGGIMEVHTRERLIAIEKAGLLSADSSADLRDALEFIGAIRLRHQARQIQSGRKADNFMSPKDLSHFERNHLKDAFALVRTIQSSMSHRFKAGSFG